jgi:branched-chain amino acid transport system permease protein
LNLLLQLLANGLVNAALFAMLAVGFGLVWRSLRVFHLAYGGLFVISGYIFRTLSVRLGWPPWIAGAATVFFAAIMGWLIELALYRPFCKRNAASSTILIASMGVLVMLENAVAMIFGNELQTVPRGMGSGLELGPIRLTPLQLLGFGLGVISVSVLWLLVRRLRTFKALWAMGDQPELIPVLGLPLYRLRAMALAIGTAMAAIPACVITLDLGIDPFVGMSYLLIAAVAVLAGGVDSYRGWVTGAVTLALLQSLVVWKFSARWMDLVTFGLLVAMLVFRPSGLVAGAKRVEEY